MNIMDSVLFYKVVCYWNINNLKADVVIGITVKRKNFLDAD